MSSPAPCRPPARPLLSRPLLCWSLMALSGGGLIACEGSSKPVEAGSAGGTESGADTGVPVGSTDGLVVEGLPVCDPAARAADGPFEPMSIPGGEVGEPFQHGDSVAVGDADGDGAWDILLADRTHLRLLMGDGRGGFVEESAERLPPGSVVDERWGEANFTGTFADLDADGDLDILAARAMQAPRVLVNGGEGVFTELAGGLGLPDQPLKPRDLPMADIDGDGDLDLFIAHDRIDTHPPEPGQPNVLLRNDGNLVFTDITDRLSDRDIYGYTKVAAFVDIEGDGDQDLYIVNHMPAFEGNRLLLNDGTGQFESGATMGADIRISGMGLSIADQNGDTLPDLVVSGWGELALLDSDPGFGFVDLALPQGLIPNLEESRWVAWGNAVADFDNDGVQDIFVAYGQAEEDEAAGDNPASQPDALYHGLKEGGYEQVADDWGLADLGVGRAVAPVDFNGDGWLDLLTHGHKEEPRLFLARCGEAARVLVSVTGTAVNPYAIGARIEVEAGGQTQVRWVRTMGASFSTGLPHTQQFGLGSTTQIDRLTVIYPDGQSRTWTGLPANQHIHVLAPID
jgi:hypothetical protein